jgi:hypothetical protein
MANLDATRGITMLAVAVVLLVAIAIYKMGNQRVKRIILVAEVWTGLLIVACSIVYLIFWRE